jgi:MFS superfamily sulfate permease-like transporter
MNKKFESLKADLPSGLVVFLVALPLCLGIALASTGRPDLLFSGIIAGVVGGIVVGIVSNSPLGVSGPAAGLVVIVLTAIETLGSFEAFLLAVALAGVLQIILGFVKAGIIAYFFPSSVIKGMLTAIGIILILKQIPHALGYDEDFAGDFFLEQKDGHNTFSELYYALKFNTKGAIIISIISLLILMFFETKMMKKIKLFSFVPGALIVVFVGIILNYLFALYAPDFAVAGKHLVQLPVASSPQEFVSFFTLPDFSFITNPQVYVVAVTLAIVASLESLLCVEATDKLDPWKRRTSANRELIAQGAGNLVSGLIGGLPVTQVIVRSSANINSGGKTKLSAIFHGIILLVSAVFIPKFLNLIPLAALAAILLMVGYKLAKPQVFIQMYKLSKLQFIAFMVTIIAIIATDLLKGIFIGMAVAIFYVIRRNYLNPSKLSKEVINSVEVYKLTLSEETTFLNKASIAKSLDEIPENSTLIIDGEKTFFIAYDVLENIQEFVEYTSKLKNINVTTNGIKEIKSSSIH